MLAEAESRTYSLFQFSATLTLMGRPAFGSTGPELGVAHGVLSAQGKAVGLNK